jgi:hypothetical protein
MKDQPILIPIIILTLLICFIIKTEGFKTVHKTCNNSNKTYEVQDYSESQKIANMIGEIEIIIGKFTKYLKNKYPFDDRIKRLVSNIKHTKYIESEFEKQTSSFTINKGEMISLCLRQKDKDKTIHTMDTLMFVVIHELGHVITESEGHTQEWLDNFRFLLREAKNGGFYEPVNYSKKNMNYCGVDVTHNPYYNSD